MSKITNDRLNPVWHRTLYSCTNMATVGVKGLSSLRQRIRETDRQTDRSEWKLWKRNTTTTLTTTCAPT